MKRTAVLSLLLLAGCGGGAVPPVWQSNAKSALDSFEQNYLLGDTRVANLEFDIARKELASTGAPALVARAELLRCAARTASLEFDDCPGFAALRTDAGAEEAAYAEFLAGRGERAPGEDPLSRLVSLGVKLKSGKITPPEIAAAVDIASAQGWRRPLLAWLRVQEKRAQAAGDGAALEQIRRRIALATGKG